MDRSLTEEDRGVNETALFGALESETTRAILAHTSEQARSANELAELIDVSLTTIYRRLEQLTEEDLVHETLQLDRSGDHYKVYRAKIRRVNVAIDDDEVYTHVEWREDMADRFTRIWEEIRR